MAGDSLAFCGAAGGVGTTRLTLESAVSLARDGRSVAVLDAAFATQGLGEYVPGRLESDMTRLCLEDGRLLEGLVDLPDVDPGRVAVCPARAPFERLARAKTPKAAMRFESRIDEASRAFDHVLVDVPPIAANQAVAAATGTDRLVAICDADRAGNALPRVRDRLLDLDVELSATAVTFTDAHPDADVTIPETDAEFPGVVEDGSFATAVHDALEATLSIELEFEAQAGLTGLLSR